MPMFAYENSKTDPAHAHFLAISGRYTTLPNAVIPEKQTS